jgi:hypothetical protein
VNDLVRLWVTALALVATSATLWLATPATAGAEATHRPAPAWTIQVDPLTTALGYVHVQVERRVTAGLSLYAGPHARMFSGFTADEDDDVRGVGAEIGLRWFFRGVAPAGSWAQVRGVGARVSRMEDATLGGYVSALGGHTWILRGRWVLSAGLGIQYVHYAVNDVGPKGVLPAAHSTFGIAF